MDNDIEFIKSFNGYRIPCNLTFNEEKEKYHKKAVAKWANLTLDDVSRLEATNAYNDHSMFIMGDKTGQFVIDIDRKKPDRSDHDKK